MQYNEDEGGYRRRIGHAAAPTTKKPRCEFVDSVDSVFRSEDIAAALSDEVAPLFGSVA